MKQRPLEGRFAVITGASEGIGQGIARGFAAAGVAGMLLAQRNAARGAAEAHHLREQWGVEAIALETDVCHADQVDAMIAAAHTRFGRIDILVNNAGGSIAKRLEDHSDEDMAAAFALNYTAVFRAMRAVFPIMRAQRYGRIINIGSLNGVNAHMYTAGYNASKEAMRTLSRTAAVEWGVLGIAVSVICPAAMSSAARRFFDANPAMMQALCEQIPVGRFGDAEADIAPVAVFLACEQAGYASGNTVFVSGGSHINGVTWRPDVDV